MTTLGLCKYIPLSKFNTLHSCTSQLLPRRFQEDCRIWNFGRNVYTRWAQVALYAICSQICSQYVAVRLNMKATCTRIDSYKRIFILFGCPSQFSFSLMKIHVIQKLAVTLINVLHGVSLIYKHSKRLNCIIRSSQYPEHEFVFCMISMIKIERKKEKKKKSRCYEVIQKWSNDLCSSEMYYW